MESIGGDANPGLSLDSSTGTFTAASGFASYLWKLDGVLAPSTLNTFSVDVSATSTLSAGVHNVLLVVTDSDGNSYSVTATIKIER